MAIEAREVINKGRHSSGNDKKMVARLLSSNGQSTREIGKLLNVSHVTVQNWLKG